MNASSEVSKTALIAAISDLLKAVPVKESLRNETVWEGIVQIFALKGHPAARRCYAWSYITDKKTGKRKFFAILHQGSVDSPQTALHVAIVAEYRKNRK